MMQTLDIESVAPSQKRILVVDDYPPMRQLIREALHHSPAYEVSEAENGMEALEKCRHAPYDLVISDLRMPGMGGLALLGNLRDSCPDTSVIMITGFPETELTVSAMKNGAVDFLTKPFRIEDLIYKVHICLQEQKLPEEAPPASGGGARRCPNRTEALAIHGYIYDSFDDIEGENSDIFEKIVDLTLKIVEGGECALLLFDEESGGFDPRIVRGGDADEYRDRALPLLKGVFERVVREKEPLLIHCCEHPGLAPSLICAPLVIRNHVFGMLTVRRKPHREPFTPGDLNHISRLTKRSSLNLENRILYESVYRNAVETFSALITSVQVRDHYTEEHCSRVTRLSVRTAERIQCNEKEIESIKIAGMLHDVGKIAIPDSVLLKPDRLTTGEYAIIKTHPDLGERVLKPILLFDGERDIIRHHHERWDGKGYPAGMSGPEIPLLSRIVAVADAFDAMTNNRPYRRCMSTEAAILELNRCSGSQFDPQVVQTFLKTIAEHPLVL